MSAVTVVEPGSRSLTLPRSAMAPITAVPPERGLEAVGLGAGRSSAGAQARARASASQPDQARRAWARATIAGAKIDRMVTKSPAEWRGYEETRREPLSGPRFFAVSTIVAWSGSPPGGRSPTLPRP